MAGGTIIDQWKLTGYQYFMAFDAGGTVTTSKQGAVTEGTVIRLIAGCFVGKP